MRAYRKDVAEAVIAGITSRPVRGIEKICKEIGVSHTTVYDWIMNNHEGFGEEYARAKMIQADLAVEEAYDIADDRDNDTYVDEFGNRKEDKEWTSRMRERVGLRKWHASKLAPRVYGDKLDVTTGGEQVQSMNVDALIAIADRIAANADKATEDNE